MTICHGYFEDENRQCTYKYFYELLRSYTYIQWPISVRYWYIIPITLLWYIPSLSWWSQLSKPQLKSIKKNHKNKKGVLYTCKHLLSRNQRHKHKQKSLVCSFDYFSGVNAPSMANFKWPTWHRWRWSWAEIELVANTYCLVAITYKLYSWCPRESLTIWAHISSNSNCFLVSVLNV